MRCPAALLLLALLGACDEGDVGESRLLVEGDPALGRAVIAREGCGACHQIPGLRGARGRVGPSLAGFARRGYIAGQFPNRAPMLIRWIREAPALVPATVMPGFALTERELRDVAAYLYRLD
ncbi:c-type cytochrome [Belnapia sp. T6]|uniref:C-type cytochrome n=1 Tax=Belnapia mucosa TaxID=2804532 RepID=A0ABS1V0P5_9PROT|nr:c-type cytochrome [Belnapia mucosa]MBL6455274.1 c-type cytochrome [Belnapia mucosa]